MTTSPSELDSPANSLPPATVNEPPRGGVDLFTLEAAAEFCGMHPEMILEFLRARLVVATYFADNGDAYFDERAVFRLRQIEEMRTSTHFDLHSIRFVVTLLDRVEKAEAELRRLRALVR